MKYEFVINESKNATQTTERVQTRCQILTAINVSHESTKLACHGNTLARVKLPLH